MPDGLAILRSAPLPGARFESDDGVRWWAICDCGWGTFAPASYEATVENMRQHALVHGSISSDGPTPDDASHRQ